MKVLFSAPLQAKLDTLLDRRKKVSLGRVEFDSPLLLAPMSAICHAPFRLLMGELGAGGTVSELVSCHGINHGNDRTLKMLRIDRREGATGLQLFGECSRAMAKAALVAAEYNYREGGGKASFIDINMGCPVRKVVSKGGGAALLREPRKLISYFGAIKRDLPKELPLTIKIRLGWDDSDINAAEVIRIAHGEGVEFVAVHGRTRAQQYRGAADWKLLESLARESSLPIVGNGDLHSAFAVRSRLEASKCSALMLGRGPLREPFLFATSYLREGEVSPFSPEDYREVLEVYVKLLLEYDFDERAIAIQTRKMAAWFSSGFSGAGKFRRRIFEVADFTDLLSLTEDFFGTFGGGKREKGARSRPPVYVRGARVSGACGLVLV